MHSSRFPTEVLDLSQIYFDHQPALPREYEMAEKLPHQGQHESMGVRQTVVVYLMQADAGMHGLPDLTSCQVKSGYFTPEIEVGL